VFTPDGTHLVAPTTPANSADKVGLKTKATRPFYDLIIIGGGPAGLANAVYAASEGPARVVDRAQRARRHRPARVR
jgi:thioredoxin reductase (NADPH)